MQIAKPLGYSSDFEESRPAVTKLENKKELFAGRHFDREVIILCVRWYLCYKLSLRDLAEIMAERGLHLAHTTIMRSCAGCSAVCPGV